MEEQDWENFFRYCDMIVREGGTWQEKKAGLVEMYERLDSSSFGEIVSWFDGDIYGD